MRKTGAKYSARWMCGAAAAVLCAYAGVASAQEQATFDIPAQPLAEALKQFGMQSGHDVLAAPALAEARTSRGVAGVTDVELALNQVLEGSGLTYRRSGNTFLIVQDPQGGSAGAGAGGDVDALIVTAQKREENIQDVPIAISAFSQEDLTTRQVAGGPDLMTQVPNMTFTKTNFSSYSIQIRGIGTQAISATTDAAVAVAFNNTSFIRNRFFEQEFYDLQRVEVLRGPQGTLYGRNATAGVVNIISAKPKFIYEARASGDVANYNSMRLEGMVNIPLVEDAAALRVAGAWTKRDGFVTNQITGNPIDGRDLWSTRVSLRLAPTDAIDVNLIWEHFEETDDRLRSGKQLCKTDEITNFAGFPTTHYQLLGDYGQYPGLLFAGVQGSFSQGCAPASLYSTDESFGTPNGISLPYYLPLGAVFLPTALDDPYASRTQSHDLRVIESTIDPRYNAVSDLGEIQVGVDITDNLTLTSETAYLADDLFSLQDYNRFNTAPGAWGSSIRPGVMQPGPNGNVFCDPQLGCTDRLVAVDVSSAKSRQFSQELRLSSDYDGPFNFSVGANYLRYDTEDKYYVFINSLSIIAAISPYANILTEYLPGADNSECLLRGPTPPDFLRPAGVLQCTYIDPNPIGSLNDQGHNYFLSRNPYKLISYAAFGEAYYNVTDTLKITAGLRVTADRKEAPRIPSWVLAADSVGYPVTETVQQEWTEPTGRLGIDWKPDLSFTDETLLYFSYAHGYKAGGANPPPMGVVCYSCGAEAQGVVEKSAAHPKTFDPEFVDAFELGAKNTFLDGRLTVNTAAFYYDYTGYQISQIVNRSAVNLNFDAQVRGVEVEADWRPLENLRLGFKGGYENTKVADGMKAIDLMDRTGGNDAWAVYKPFPTFPSNCVLPKWLFIGNPPGATNPALLNVGGRSGGNPGGCELAYVMSRDPVTNAPYELTPDSPFMRQGVNYADWSTDPADYPGWPTGVPITNGMDYPGWDPTLDYGNNGGEGFYKDLSGNALPNAPHFTATITADWSMPLPNDWLATLHTDLYYQSEAWTRIFNMEGYDKLKAYSNINLALLLNNEEAGWHVMAYVKNVLDRDSITGAFLNSDDSGLTTNVFLTEPRLYGLRVTKDFTGGSLLGSFGQRHEGPYAFTVELGGQVQRHDASYQALRPGFAGDLSPTLDAVFDTAQNQDLDWGDGRDVRVTYTPDGVWRVSAAMRVGKTNSGRRYLASEEGDRGCNFGAPCPYISRLVLNPFIGENYADGTVFDREEHTVVDFAVGREVGLGLGSRLSGGIRYAELESTTQLESTGIPDWQIPDTGAWFIASQHHLEESSLLADREFSGAGPVAAWGGSAHLLGGEDTGRVDLDWSIEGGVLFGKQKTAVTGEETSRYFSGPRYYNYAFTTQVGPTVTTPLALARSRSVTVPTAALSVGLSYGIDRVKIGAGYRWERYFDALDAGFATAEDADRTIDGPYFKVSIGFGG